MRKVFKYLSGKPWLMQGHHASGCRGLPGDEGTIGKKCDKLAERIAGSNSLLEGLFTGKVKMVILTV
jgi:hypothetical protein